MAFLPNNGSGSDVVSKSSLFYEKAVIISGNIDFPTEFVSPILRIQGLPNITITGQGATDGSAPTYPDSTVGMVLVSIFVASGNAGEFEAGLGLSFQKIGEWSCPLTSVPTFESPPLFQNVQCSAKFLRFRVNFADSPPDVSARAKLYVRVHASA